MANIPIQSFTTPGSNDIYVNNPESIASQFDAAVSYSVGDYAYYNNKLYRFTAAHSGAWNAEHVVETTVGEDLGSAVTDVQINGSSVVSDGVAEIPIASGTDLGVVKVDNQILGLYVNSNQKLSIAPAGESTIKASTDVYKPIVPFRQHIATFYGLAKAASDTTQSQSSNAVGNYTEEARSKISEMLNAPVTVSGTTPTINAMSGVRYVCGEVATLSITPPQTGCIDVVFTSGGTPTALTVPSTVKWANGFDPDNLEANTTYEINILDGVMGVAGSWA